MPRFKEESVEADDATLSQTPTPGPGLPLEQPEYQETLRDLRNMSEFAELVQFLSFFKTLFKITNTIDIDMIEEELLGINTETEIINKFQTQVITQLARHKRSLAGYLEDLNVTAWHLFAYRGFEASENPMGTSTEPEELSKFETMDPSTRITILYAFSRWIVMEDGFHDKVEKLLAVAAKDGDEDGPSNAQSFKVDPVGWRGDFGVYYLLDDNRLYYMEDQGPDLSEVNPKELPGYKEPKKEETGKKRRGEPLSSIARKRRARAAQRRKSGDEVKEEKEEEKEEEPGKTQEYISLAEALGRDTPLEKIKWECVCVTLEDWEKFVESLRLSKKEYDKLFYKYLNNHLLPVLREHEEKRVREAWARERARIKSRLVVNRKRSSRLEEKSIRLEQRAEDERRNAEEQRHRIEQRRMEREERERLAAREKRLEERDERILRERLGLKPINQQLAIVQQELEEEEESSGRRRSARNSRSSSPAPNRSTRSSSRISKNKEPVVIVGVRRLGAVTENWEFDCKCGIFGDNYDDGKLIVKCKECALWMHVKCLSEREELEKVAARANEGNIEPESPPTHVEYEYTCERCERKQQEEETRLIYAREVAERKQRLKDQQQARKAAQAAAAAQAQGLANAGSSIIPGLPSIVGMHDGEIRRVDEGQGRSENASPGIVVVEKELVITRDDERIEEKMEVDFNRGPEKDAAAGALEPDSQGTVWTK